MFGNVYLLIRSSYNLQALSSSPKSVPVALWSFLIWETHQAPNQLQLIDGNRNYWTGSRGFLVASSVTLVVGTFSCEGALRALRMKSAPHSSYLAGHSKTSRAPSVTLDWQSYSNDWVVQTLNVSVFVMSKLLPFLGRTQLLFWEVWQHFLFYFHQGRL